MKNTTSIVLILNFGLKIRISDLKNWFDYDWKSKIKIFSFNSLHRDYSLVIV